MFFELQPKNAVLSDASPFLINAFTQVRDKPMAVSELLRTLHDSHSDSQYYKVREALNSGVMNTAGMEIAQAAYFIYLNRAGFNGLMRVNSKGYINVPIGTNRNLAALLDAEIINEASASLKGKSITLKGFEQTLVSVMGDAFVYLDPPYDGGFTGYTAGGFGEAEQRALASVFGVLTKRGVNVMLSSSDTPLIRELYGYYNIYEVPCARSINSDGKGRGKVTELVITNYNPKVD